ncbi:hypothetical protein [Curtanaerobium respiraculi]|uniref:hypothetical protein n=1 Tax=Curtanaerobium respiraculi TaxID=2949669 RepID=UPI0024B3813C|nr:hypothetical protein [Curtanaerobium respiraculi]
MKYTSRGLRRCRGTVETSTMCDYKKSRNCIARYIGSMRLCDLRIDDVNAWMAEMNADGLSARTISKRFHVLKQTLKHAQAWTCAPWQATWGARTLP